MGIQRVQQAKRQYESSSGFRIMAGDYHVYTCDMDTRKAVRYTLGEFASYYPAEAEALGIRPGGAYVPEEDKTLRPGERIRRKYQIERTKLRRGLLRQQTFMGQVLAALGYSSLAECVEQAGQSAYVLPREAEDEAFSKFWRWFDVGQTAHKIAESGVPSSPDLSVSFTGLATREVDPLVRIDDQEWVLLPKDWWTSLWDERLEAKDKNEGLTVEITALNQRLGEEMEKSKRLEKWAATCEDSARVIQQQLDALRTSKDDDVSRLSDEKREWLAQELKLRYQIRNLENTKTQRNFVIGFFIIVISALVTVLIRASGVK